MRTPSIVGRAILAALVTLALIGPGTAIAGITNAQPKEEGARLRGLLTNRDFAALDRYFEAIQARYEEVHKHLEHVPVLDHGLLKPLEHLRSRAYAGAAASARRRKADRVRTRVLSTTRSATQAAG